MKICQRLFLCLCFLLAGCAGRLPSSAPRPAEDFSSAQAGDNAAAMFAGEHPAGAAAVFPLTSLGTNVTMTVDREYLSALNIPCKKVIFNTGGNPAVAAVCKTSEGWRLVPTIFSGKGGR